MSLITSSKQNRDRKFTIFVLCWRLWLICLAGAGSALQAQTAARVYELNNSYAETNGGSAMVPNGGTLGATGYTFAAGQGPGASGVLANTGEYTIEMVFTLDSVSGYRCLLNFNNLTSDFALYCLSGRATFYLYNTGNSTTTDFVAGQTHRLVVTRNATTKVTTAYVDGVQKAQVTDSNNYYVASATNGIIHFFRDNGGEHPTGFVDQIRIYNSVLTPTQVAALGQTPVAQPEIEVVGNNVVIADGDRTPALEDNTLFEGVGAAKSLNYIIRNTGSGVLTVSSLTVASENGAQFYISSAPAPIAAGSIGHFTVTYVPPAGTGAPRALVTINSNDADEAVYDFAVEGKVDTNVTATYATGAEVPVSADGFTATGGTANFTLNYAPVAGTELMVVKNTGLGFINGTFNNLPHGQPVALSFGGVTYPFVANYYGGTGNDLVLQWANTRALAWGSGAFGQLGIGTTPQFSTQPAAVVRSGSLAGKTVIAVSGGFNSSLALCSDGTLHAWGQNTYGQLGDNSTTNRSEPVPVIASGVLAGKTVVAIASGEDFQLVLCSDGTLATWGNNQTGQLGNGTVVSSSVPVLVNRTGVLAGKTVVAISAGAYHGLALCSDGTVAGWGYNPLGQLGNNATANSSVPVLVNSSGVLAGKKVSSVSAGAYFNLALCSDGTLVAWGDNRSQQLGNNSTAESSLVPVLVDRSGVLAGKTVVSVAAGRSHSVLLCADGTLAAWGYNASGAVGDGTNTNRALPVLVNQAGVLAGKVVTKVWAAFEHNLALCSDGSLAAWGSNGYGQLGNNSMSTPLSPVLASTAPLPPGARFTSGSAKLLHSIALAAYPPPPAITSLSPTAGGVLAGTRVTINGTSLTGVTAVTVNGAAATNILFINDTRIQADFPAGVAGPASVLVTTSAGTNAANSLYTYMPAPSITGVSPNRGTINGGTSVTITGSGFNELSAVQFGGVAGTITSSTPTAITVVTPPRPVGAAHVFVATAFGNVTSTNGFTYTVPPPGDVDPLNVSIVGTIVLSTAVQPDGGTIIAGNFSQVLGATRSHVVRLLPDGTLDASFNPSPNGPVTSVAVQLDGKILLGGQFTALQPNGAASPTTRNRLARLNADGTLDPSFNPNANATVQVLAPQADGRILVGGSFNALQPNGAASPATRNRVARLLADGTLDPAFDPNANDDVLSLAVQDDGRILLAGRFTSLQPAGAASAATRNRVARLNADGTLDTGFNPNANGPVNTLAVQADGRVLLGGAFTSLQPNGAASPTARSNIARVLADGSLDTTFDPSANGAVNSLALQADGRVLAGGAFTALQPNGAAGPTTRNRVARMNADGALDPAFDPNANNTVFSVAHRSDGAVLLGGFFTTLQPSGATAPVTRDYFARLYNDAATQSLSTADSSRVRWTRGGSVPALTGARFEISTDSGSTWTPLPGAATRVGTSADWELLNADFPATGLLRARGRTAGSFQSGGSGLVEFQSSYTAPLASPLVTAVAPDLGTTLGGDVVTVSGIRFTGATAVTFGGNAAASFTVLNASTISAVTPAGVAGTAAVQVTTPSGASPGNPLFTYVAPPVVTNVTPPLGSTLGGTSIVIAGSNFINVTGVDIGGAPAASYVVDGPSQITATTPAGTAGVASVTVRIDGALSAANTLYTFVPPPIVSQVTPASGNTLGGQTVTLTGENFGLATSVTFGGVAAGSFTVNGPTSITATVPPGPTGAASVVVTTPGGTNSANTLYSYLTPPPEVSNATPALGSTLGGEIVTLGGSHFTGATSVSFGGVAAPSFTVVNSGTITVTTPARNAGPVSITVTTPGGASPANTLYTYVDPAINVTLTSSLNPSVILTPATFTSHVTSVRPVSGQVEWFIDNASAGATTVNASGMATFTPTSVQLRAGERTIKAVFKPSANSAVTFERSITQTVAKSPLPITLHNLRQLYDGTPKFVVAAVTPPPGFTVTPTVTYAGAADAPVNAGNYAVVATIDHPDFTGSANETLEVLKDYIRYTVSANSFVYNGQPQGPVLTFTPADRPVEVTYRLTSGLAASEFFFIGAPSTSVPTEPGVYRASVTTTNPNYLVVPSEFEFQIQGAPLEVDLTPSQQPYTGSPRRPSIFAKPSDVPFTLTYQRRNGGSLVGAPSTEPPTQVGDYLVYVSSPGRFVTPRALFYTITKRGFSAEVSGLKRGIDGQPKPVTVVTSPPNIPVVVTYNSGSISTTTAPSGPPPGGGAWQVVVTPVDTSTYIGAFFRQMTFTPRTTPSISITGPSTFTYDWQSGCEVTVRGASGAKTPTGTITFKHNGNSIANVPLNAFGAAKLQLKSYFVFRTAPYQVTAEYSGDELYLPGTSNPLSFTITKEVVPGFTYDRYKLYKGGPLVIPDYYLFFKERFPNRVKGYTITHNGSTTLPSNVTTAPLQLQVSYDVGIPELEYRDTMNLHILPAAVPITISNLEQNARVGATYPVKVTTDPAGIAHSVTYTEDGVPLAGVPNKAGIYFVIARITDPNYDPREARGTLVVSQSRVNFQVSNLDQNYDGKEKSVSVVASPSIPYLVTYNNILRRPVAPGTYDVRVFPEDESRYGSGSRHTMVIRARIDATVNGQRSQGQLSLVNARGVSLGLPANVNPSQEEYTLRFIDSDTLKFKRWKDGFTDNPRRLIFGGPQDPATYTLDAEATVLSFVKPTGSGNGEPLGSRYCAAGELVRFDAYPFSGNIVNRWVYNGKTVVEADGHRVLDGGRTVYLKIAANAGHPHVEFVPGFFASGYGSGGEMVVNRADRPDLAPVAEVGVPTGTNYYVYARPSSGYQFLEWINTPNSTPNSAFVRHINQSYTNPTAEYRKLGTSQYSYAKGNFIKIGPDLSVTQITPPSEVPNATYYGLGALTSDFRIYNGGQMARDVRIRDFYVTGYRLRLHGDTKFRYFYPDARTDKEKEENITPPLMSDEHKHRFLAFSPSPNALFGIDVRLGDIAYQESAEATIGWVGSGNANFGLWATAEMRVTFQVDYNPNKRVYLSGWAPMNFAVSDDVGRQWPPSP